jgi:hypothetical protein
MRSTKETQASCKDNWHNVSLFFHAPWENHNGYHSINDNLFSVLGSLYLQMSTSEVSGDINLSKRQLLMFNRLSSLGQPATTLFHLLRVLFGKRVYPASTVLNRGQVLGKPFCVHHAAWGTALKPFYRDSLHLLRYASYELLHTTLTVYQLQHLPLSEKTLPHTSFILDPLSSRIFDQQDQKKRPRVVIMTRNTTSHPTRKLSYQTELKLQQLFANSIGAAHVVVCCDFDTQYKSMNTPSSPSGNNDVKISSKSRETIEDFVDDFHDRIDICIGIHGAGLGNCALGSPGMVMIELQTLHNFGFDSFMKIAHMARGSYAFFDLRPWIRTMTKSQDSSIHGQGMVLNEAVLQDIVDLSLAMWEHNQQALPKIESRVQSYLRHKNFQQTTADRTSWHRRLSVDLRNNNNNTTYEFDRRLVSGTKGKSAMKGRFASKAETLTTLDSVIFKDEFILDFAAQSLFVGADNQIARDVVAKLGKSFREKPLHAHGLYAASTESYTLNIQHREFIVFLNPFLSQRFSQLPIGNDPTKEVLGPPTNLVFEYCVQLPYYKFKLITRQWADHRGNCDKPFIQM